jgi:hypothetical protein
MPEKRTLILAVGLQNVKVRRSTGPCAQIRFSGAIRIEKDLSQHVDVPAQSFKLGGRPFLRLGIDEFPQFFKLIHRNSMQGIPPEKKMHKEARGCTSSVLLIRTSLVHHQANGTDSISRTNHH